MAAAIRGSSRAAVAHPASAGPGGACGPKSWGDGTAVLGPSPPGPAEASLSRGLLFRGRPAGLFADREALVQ